MSAELRTSIRTALVALGLALFCMWASVRTTAGQAGVVVRPDPDVLSLATGADGAVILRFENVQNLYGLEAHLTFDPAIVEVLDLDASKPGVQVQIADWLAGGFVATNQVDNSTGKIDIAATLINPALPIDGAGSIATISFRGKLEGVSPLTLDSIILATRDSDVITSQAQNGRIGVSADGRFPESEPSAPTASVPAQPVAAPSTSPVPAGANLLNLVTFLSIVAFLVALATFVYAIRSR